MGIFSMRSVDGCVTAHVACLQEVNRILESGELLKYSFPELRIKQESVEQEDNQSERTDEEASGRVLGLCVSPSGRLVAALNDRKTVCIWRSDGTVLASWQTVRKASCLTFSGDEQSLLVADKSGDVYRCKLHEPDEKPQLILGHISMVLDMVVTADGRHVVTCDRDEKIRVTRYPAVHCIDAYCLGHSEFVATLCLTQRGRLASSGGDMTVRLWEPNNGRQLACVGVASPDTDSSDDSRKVAVTSLVTIDTPDTCLLAAQVHGWSRLAVFLVSPDDQLTRLPELQLEAVPHALSAAAGRLYVLSASAAAPITVYGVESGGQPGLSRLPGCPLTDAVAARLARSLQDSLRTEDVGWLFKQWFDNVSQYLSRKEQRLNADKKALEDNSQHCSSVDERLEYGNAPKRLKPFE